MRKFMIMTMVQKNGKCIKVIGNKVFSCPAAGNDKEERNAVSNRK